MISGGQTGVDRAALDAARALGIGVGGWCPAGRWAEDGPIATRYPLRETPQADPAVRTRWNVRDSAATLILHRGTLAGGARLCLETAEALGRPVQCVALTGGPPEAGVIAWMQSRNGRVNIAGPRASEAPGIYEEAYAYLIDLLTQTAAR